MNRINFQRVIIGGVIAAIILFGIAGIVDGLILGKDWRAWQDSLGSAVHPPPRATEMAIWAIVSIIMGITGVWIYAGIRPRYGPGPATAFIAGVMLWLAAIVPVVLGHFALGDLPSRIALIDGVAGLVRTVLAMVAGCAIYRE